MGLTMRNGTRSTLCIPCLFTLVAMLSYGCAPMEAYEGPRLPEEEISVIAQAPASVIMAQKAIPAILCIDGKNATGQTVHVAPGQHQVIGCLSDPPAYGIPLGAKTYVCHLEFETEAGHEYYVNGSTQDGVTEMWVLDVTTDETVARSTAKPEKNLRSYDCGSGG